MKEITHCFTCVTCLVKKIQNKEGLPLGWIKVTPPASPEVPVREDVFFCDQCLTQGEFAEVVGGVRGIPTDYVPYLEIQKISCDRNGCIHATETIIGPPGRLQGINSLPWGAWVTCTRGLPVPAETHFCLPCSQRLGLFPSSGQPIKKDGPPTGIGGRASGDLDLHFS